MTGESKQHSFETRKEKKVRILKEKFRQRRKELVREREKCK